MSYAGPAASSGRLAAIRPAESARMTPGTVPPRVLVRQPPERAGKIAVFAAGIALGIALGAGVALLFAPQSGEETRHALARRGRLLGRRSHDAWDDLRYELRRVGRRGRRLIGSP
jgi:hypothetical protein